MAIDSLSSTRILSGSTAGTSPVDRQDKDTKTDNAAAPTSGSAKIDRADRVQISNAAQQLNPAADQSQRLAALKTSIQNGTYQVNSQKIAEKLLSSAL